MNLKKIMAATMLGFLSVAAAADTFSVKYKPVATLSLSDKIEGEVQITNTGTQSVNLSTTSVQYYFTKEGSAAMVGTSDYAAILGTGYRVITSNVRLAFDATKINITFGTTSGLLLVGQTLNVQFRANATDWFKQNQTNDPSFNASLTTFTPVTNITVNAGASTPVVLRGAIKNTTGRALTGAKIKFLGGEATTLADGSFTATANISGPVAITVSAPGYADLSKTYAPVAGKIVIFASLLAVDKTQIINTNVANTVTTSGGASVTFPPMFDITEQLSVSLTHIRSNTRDILSASGDFSGLTSTGEQVQLASQGMLDVVVRGVQTGQIYSLANKGPFTIKIPASIPATAPTSIPLWYYNTASGKWMEEGSASLTNGVYVGDVTHFTEWNVDVPACRANGTCACITGTVSDPSNIGFVNSAHLYTILAEGSGWSKTLDVTTDNINPNFALNLLPPGPSTLTVINRSTGWRGSLNRTVAAGPSCTVFPPVNLTRTSINGTVTNACNNAFIAGASVEVFNEGGQLVATATTDSAGTYFFPALALLTDVNYFVQISNPLFVTAMVDNVRVTDSQILVLTNALNVPDDHINGNLTGRVINAVDGLPLSNTAYQVRAGINNLNGPVLFTGTTDANGQYATSLPLGNYSVRAFNGVGFGTANAVSAVCARSAPNIVIGPTIPGVRIIMSWNRGTPNDLDSYLSGPGFRINYQARVFGATASLNIDAMDANTVEVITLSQQAPGAVYTFSVNDFTNLTAVNSLALSRSDVSVTVVQGGVVTDTFNIAPGVVGNLWRVFTLTDGVVTPINSMTTVSNTNSI